MRPVHTLPTLEQLAADPQRATTLPVATLKVLAARAHMAQSACLLALIAAPAEVVPVEEERLISTKELAALMGVSSNFVFDHRHEWPFTIKRPGMRAMFSLQGYRAWVASQDGRAVPPRRQVG
jgi:hypothetical protein